MGAGIRLVLLIVDLVQDECRDGGRECKWLPGGEVQSVEGDGGWASAKGWCAGSLTW